MPCLILIIALMLPRVALALILFFTRWFSAVFDTALLPILGFIFLPYTTLAYMGAVLNAGAVAGFWWIILILAFIVDLGHFGSMGRGRRRA